MQREVLGDGMRAGAGKPQAFIPAPAAWALTLTVRPLERVGVDRRVFSVILLGVLQGVFRSDQVGLTTLYSFRSFVPSFRTLWLLPTVGPEPHRERGDCQGLPPRRVVIGRPF